MLAGNILLQRMGTLDLNLRGILIKTSCRSDSIRYHSHVFETQRRSVVMYRVVNNELQVLLVHPGGPFWTQERPGNLVYSQGRNRRGQEAPLSAARREFQEETGFDAQGDFIPLGKIRQKSGKVVEAWAFAGNCDPALLTSVLCSVEWPPDSGRQIKVPEVDRAGWFGLEDARTKLMEAQWPFLDRLRDLLETNPSKLSSN